MLASLQSELSLGLANNTLQSQNNLLGGLSLLVENRLGLTTVTGLLPVVSSLTLSEQGSLTSLVLGDLVLSVLLALLALAVGLSSLGNVDHFGYMLWNRQIFTSILSQLTARRVHPSLITCTCLGYQP